MYAAENCAFAGEGEQVTGPVQQRVLCRTRCSPQTLRCGTAGGPTPNGNADAHIENDLLSSRMQAAGSVRLERPSESTGQRS